jgi:GT2 family glycosyltransferase
MPNVSAPVWRIGVVLIGRNEGERLVTALRSVGSEASTVVYVDSGSTDGSIAAAERAGVGVVRLDLTKPFTAARARNAGFAALMARDPTLELVQFIDGDCELDPAWLGTAAAFLAANPKVAVAGGRCRERFPEQSIYNRLFDMEWDTPIGETKACAGNFLARCEAFRQVAGFSESMIAGEEADMCARMRQQGWKIWRLDAEMVRHDANMMHLWQWWRRNTRGGYAYALLAKRHGSGPDALGKRSVKSALIWGGLLPVAIVLGALVYPPVIAAAVVYPIQAARIGWRSPYKGWDAVLYGTSVMCGKVAECVGITKFALAEFKGRQQTLIEYK